jgi:hypothetical protein
VHQLVQLSGALLVLSAFVLAQLRLVRPDAGGYLLGNLVGAAALAVDAYLGAQWGFLLLEGVWAAVSAASLARTLRLTRPAAPARPRPRGGRRARRTVP